LADFGIARIAHLELGQRITSTGSAVGTLLYMSPEQLCAEPQIDGRSDQYSLACVLYEMLAGVRPHIAATFEGLRMLRMSGHYVALSTHRPRVPENVDKAIQQALSPMSADRFRTVDEFLSALSTSVAGANTALFASTKLDSPTEKSLQTGDSSGPTNNVRLSWKKWVALAALLGIWPAYNIASERLSARRHDPNSLSSPINIAPAIAATSDSALAATIRASLVDEADLWDGLRVANGTRVFSSVLFSATPSVRTVSDSVRLRLELRGDVSSAPRLVERVVSIEAAREPRAIAHELILEALIWHTDPRLELKDARPLLRMAGRSASALRSYVYGVAAMRDGNLDTAAANFNRAAAVAPDFSNARYQSAQIRAWLYPRNPGNWVKDAEDALAYPVALGGDSIFALALVSLGRRDFTKSCALYRSETQRKPTSFVAWYGLGECQRLDNVVIQTAEGPRFRSSQRAALSAYREAIHQAPTSEWIAALFSPIMQYTFAASAWTRFGISADAARTSYAALPSIVGDSIGFIPIARDVFNHSPPPDTWIPAVRRGQASARELTAEWITKWPDSPAAWLQRALALELSGNLNTGGGQLSAGAALDRALSHSASTFLAAQIAVAKARIALRQSDIKEAARVAREAISRDVSVDARAQALLLPLAVLVGDQRTAESLRGLNFDADSLTPPTLLDSLSAMRLRAANGGCDGLAGTMRMLEEAFRSALTPAELDAERMRLLLPAYRAAAPCIGVRELSKFNSPLLLDRAYTSIENRNFTQARARLDSLRNARTGSTVAAITWDFIYWESWAALQARDTTSARLQLTSALANLEGMSFFTLAEPDQAAGLRRGILLLSEIAAKLGPTNTERKWMLRAKDLSPITSGKNR
ncbi:MAG: hypothetical protein ABIR27_01920, partial [Dokdonella sp.]